MAEAVLDFFRAGVTDFSHTDVAERAGVHRTTVYRKWPTRAALVREALTVHSRRLPAPDTGTWRGDVHELCAFLLDFLEDPVERSTSVLLMAGQEPDFSEVLVEAWHPFIDQVTAMVARGVQRGEIREGTDPGVVGTLIAGPLVMHAHVLHTRPTPEHFDGIVEAIVRAFAPA
ncbi:TetR-like C-terminal domain-containing protein [Yinghuangia aomiensis]